MGRVRGRGGTRLYVARDPVGAFLDAPVQEEPYGTSIILDEDLFVLGHDDVSKQKGRVVVLCNQPLVHIIFSILNNPGAKNTVTLHVKTRQDGH